MRSRLPNKRRKKKEKVLVLGRGEGGYSFALMGGARGSGWVAPIESNQRICVGVRGQGLDGIRGRPKYTPDAWSEKRGSACMHAQESSHLIELFDLIRIPGGLTC